MFATDLLIDKRIFVTGGGTGLGLGMARRFVGLGAEVVLCGRREQVLRDAARDLDPRATGRVSWFPLDIRDPEAVEIKVAAMFAERPIDVLVNNAAGNFAARSETLSHRALDAIVDIVLHGTAYVTLACGRQWLARGLKGTVLSIIATYAWTGSPYVLGSAMSKAGVLAMTRSLAVEWGPRGIRLNAIAPGPFPTPGAWERLVPWPEVARTFETRNPLGRPGTHLELADLATFLISDGAAFINGDCVTIDGGEWLKGAGQFGFLETLSDAQWQELSPKKR
jgi:NAD(P)-dependent dehydrogenase (short-subunit alcohol dehydrogenase family)